MENSGTQIYPSHRFLHFLSLDSLLSLTVIPYIYIFISIYKYQISDHFLWIPTSKIKIPALSTSSIIWLGFGVSDLGFWLTFLGFRVSSWVRNGDFVPLSCHCCSGNFCFFFLSLSLSFSFFFLTEILGLWCFRLGHTSWGSTTRFFSNSQTLFTSSTLMPALCFALTATPERLLRQCW